MLKLTKKGEDLLNITKDYNIREIDLLKVFKTMLRFDKNSFRNLFGENILKEMLNHNLVEEIVEQDF
jgi:hypothetical protein